MSDGWPVDELVTENATIAETFLGFEDHGIFTFTLEFRTGSGKRLPLGGYVSARPGLGATLGRVLRIGGVSSWEALRGRHVRVTFVEATMQLHAVGHLLENEWLSANQLRPMLDGETK